jgi:hypothetical protein
MNNQRLAGTVLAAYLGQVGKQAAKSVVPAVAEAAEQGATNYFANSPLLQRIGAGTNEEVSQALGKVPVFGKTLSSMSPSIFQTTAQNLPAIGGKAAGILAGVGAQTALEAPYFMAQEMAKQRQVPTSSQTQSNLGYVLPQQQAAYNAMFLQQLQQPGNYYQGM